MSVKWITDTRRRRRIEIKLLAIWLAFMFWWTFIHNDTFQDAPSLRYSRAAGNIENIEEGLHILRDQAGVGRLREIYDHDALDRAVSEYAKDEGVDTFEAMVEVYSRSLRALLVSGGRAADCLSNSTNETDRMLASVYVPGLMEKLSNYRSSDIPVDPWGHAYSFFVGPWPETLGPIVFRCYGREYHQPIVRGLKPLPVNSTPADRLSVTVGGEEHGIPADQSMDVYIWSYGANGVSDQALYDSSQEYALPVRKHYRANAVERYLGGGDDINNWDASCSSFIFYAGK